MTLVAIRAREGSGPGPEIQPLSCSLARGVFGRSHFKVHSSPEAGELNTTLSSNGVVPTPSYSPALGG